MTTPLRMTWISLALALVLGAPSPSQGAESEPSPAEASPTGWDPIERALSDPWRFNVVIWGWLPDAPADITLGNNEVHLPESLDTILDSLQWGAMLDLEAREGPSASMRHRS